MTTIMHVYVFFVVLLCMHTLILYACCIITDKRYTLIQGTPSGAPKIVWPSSEKLDLTGLRQDIPKFTPWLSNAAAAEWDQYLTSTLPDMLVQRQDGESRWLMEDIFANSAVQNLTPAAPATTNSTADTVLAEMFAAERTPCEVNFM